ncbi:MAG: gliding motility-associated C-terminal domain-containing protein [Saprospiraceae bacterium]
MNSYSSNVMITKKTILRIGILFSFFFALSIQDLKATHIVGGDLTYRCLGNNVYELKLTMRRDCFQGAADAQFDDPASIGIYDGTNHKLLKDIIGYPDGQLLINFNADDTLNEFLISDCSVISGDVCVHTTMYIKNIILPYRSTGYSLAYQRCCRNSTLNNIIDPLNTGMTIVAELSGAAQLGCNSSPQFLSYPPIYLCVNKDISFDDHAIDIEGDSLVYSLCTPYAGGDRDHNKPQPPPEPPFDLVNWKPPFSLANLMGGVPLKIDSKTGLLTGRPNSVGQFVIGLCVTAYKHGSGVMTGTTRRDFQFNVRMCRDVAVANFTAPALDCNNSSLTVQFNNQSVLADDYTWIFDYGNPNSATSNALNPSYTYPEEGFYQVALIVSDSGMFCHDTIIHQVGVFNTQINAGFTYDVSSCDETGITLNVHDQSNGFNPNFPAASYEWLLTISDPPQIIPSSQQNPTFHFDINSPTTALLAFVVTSTSGCSATHTASFPLREISLAFNTAGDSICRGESTTLLLNGDEDLTYSWLPSVNDPVNPVVSPIENTSYSVTATDGLCVVTGQTAVAVQQLPVLEFGFTTSCKDLTAQFTNTSQNAHLYHWDFGVGNNQQTKDTSLLVTPVFTFPDSGIYTITLSSRDGCDVSVSHQITINAISETLDDQTINCFNPTIELNPVNNPGYIYHWSDGLTGSNPSVSVVDDKTFYVTISSPGLTGCEIVDSIRVIVPDPFTVEAGGDTTNCKFTPVTLTATTSGTTGHLDLVWKVKGITAGFGDHLVVTPDNTTTYSVTATDSLGCSRSDSVTVFKPDVGFLVYAFPSTDTSYCDIQSIALHATSSEGVTFNWFNAGGSLIGTDSFVLVTPGMHACFKVVGTDPLGCQNRDSVCVTPTFFNLGITADQSICLNDAVTVSVINNLPGQNLSYSWLPGGEHEQSITVHPSVTTTYTVIVTNNDLGCTDTLVSHVVVNLFDPVNVSVSSSAPNDSIVLSEDVQLFVNQNPNFGYIWTSSGGDIVPGVWNPVVTPTKDGANIYTVTVTNEHGCTGVASITIRVANPPCNDEDIFLPTGFTPNGDDVNDVLFVRSNFISTLELHIYNRWGQEVFHTNNQAVGWDGTFEGKRLAPDVFGYYMNITCPNGRSFHKKGNITLLE